ncbi:PAS domain S-box protein [Nitrosomonas sp. Nm58]|uniref:PAS domain S-box protein n=1 Tax=Nitrosomonas sp. Nm58 TaxID=200126 RepID=UPI00089B743C|nr:PAS domain S-box protein [Nitrosomonas sp. Nm58]SDY82587.1 PAS domain S-box-containing protein [Nitrosomonas sp. Nm58]
MIKHTVTDSFTYLSSQTLFHAIPEAMLLIDDAGHVMLSNPVAQNLFGYVENELRGMKVEQLMPSRYQEHHQHYREVYFSKPRKRAMGNGRDLVILNRSGQELKVDIALSPIVMEKGLYVLVTLTVIDRRRQAEKALLASEERLWLAKQAAALGVLDFDFKHNMVHCDERMHELWGSSPDEIMTHEKFLAAIHPSDRAIHQAAFNSAINSAGNGEYHAEFRIINPVDGTERWVVIAGQVHFESARASRLVGTVRDITKRKTLEKELQIHRAETEILFKQQIAIHTASAIAHELNQPLTAISAYSEVVLCAMEGGTFNTNEVKHALENCVKQTQRAGHRLHELVTFLQKGEMVTEELNLNAVVMDALKIVHSDGYSDFHQILQLEPNLPVVLANRLHIQKTLVNLLRNAVESMRAANVSLPAITIAVKTLKEKNLVIVSVLDTGPGIDQEIVSYIFDSFFTTKKTGIGMGLSISRALIEANGGQLWVDPDVSNGATFHFTLPFAS